MWLNVLVVLLFMLVADLLHAAKIMAHGFILTYSVSDRICNEATKLLKTDRACRLFDAMRCSDDDTYPVNTSTFEEIATNQYGYTQVFRATANSIKGYTIVYLNRFQGDRHPRLVQTWKVDAKALNEVLSFPPGPIPAEGWRSSAPRPSRETNATEFAAMLNGAEKVSNEWSPVIEILSSPYLVERECSGRWAYGGFYACNKVIKLTVKKLASDQKTMPYCQFARPRNK